MSVRFLLRGVLAALILLPTVVMAHQPPVQPAAPSAPELASASPAPDAAVPLTATQWAERIIDKPNSLTEADVGIATASIEEALKAGATDQSLLLAQGFLLHSKGEHKAALARGREIAARDPKSAQAWYLVGVASFDQAQTASMMDKMDFADDGKAAMLKAVELDPAFIDARMALGMYYVMAPGIAGGSNRKATEQANELLKLEGGAYTGRTLLALVAADKGDWKEMSAQYQLMESAAADQRGRLRAVLSHARSLLNSKEDPKAAVVQAERALKLAETDQEKASARFLLAEARRKLGERDKAIEEYRAVLAFNPDATNSRWHLAGLLADAKAYVEAAEHYEEFAKRFPKDERTEKARENAKKMRKKAG